MKKIISIIFVGVCLFIFLVFSMKELDVTSTSYKNYSEVASKSGLFEAGWIPLWLPKTASNIQESHDIDTNESWLMFNFVASDKFYLRCALINKKAIRFPSIDKIKRLPDFVANNFGKLQSDDSLTFYECEGVKGKILALNNKDNTAYVWGLSG